MVVGDFPLGGKIVVATGGGSGITLAFVRLALNAGAKVLVADLTLTPEAEALVARSSGKAAFTKCDVSDWSNLSRLPTNVSSAFGHNATADIWIAGAGVFEPRWSSFLHDTEIDHYRTLQINTEHPIKLTRIAMRSALGANEPCVILIIASSAGLVGTYGSALYCASKHAVVGFTKAMAPADVDENVKVVCICPGMVATPLWTGESEDAKGVAAQYSYSDEMCETAEEVAGHMRVLIEEGRYRGGAIMRTSKGREPEIIEGEYIRDDGNEAKRAWIERA